MTAYASAARVDGLFDQARQLVSIEDLVVREGCKVVRAGKELRTFCPVCGAGAKSRSAFAIKGEKWRCYGGCDTHGDVVDLEQALRGGTPVEAARRLVGAGGEFTPRPRPAPRPAPSGPSVADQLAVEIWTTARPFAASLAEKYLRHRGIPAPVLALAAPNLRYHPFAKHHWDGEARDWIKAPALVLQVVTASGPTGGVHVTYLARDGQGKARLEPAKRMWGPQLDADGRPGGAWLIGPGGEGDLVVAEGVETALSVAALAHRAGVPMRCAAALSLNRLQGGVLRDDDGCIDAIHPQPDPASPAFTWPAPADSPWPEVRIAVDRDMGEVRVKARTGRDKVCSFLLTAETRARLCGRLAVAAWRAAGAAKVRAIAPSPRSDFNDELRRVLALEGCK